MPDGRVQQGAARRGGHLELRLQRGGFRAVHLADGDAGGRGLHVVVRRDLLVDGGELLAVTAPRGIKLDQPEAGRCFLPVGLLQLEDLGAEVKLGGAAALDTAEQREHDG